MTGSVQAMQSFFAQKRRLVYQVVCVLGLCVAIPKVYIAWQHIEASFIHRYYYPLFISFVLWVIYALGRNRINLVKAERLGMIVLLIHYFIGLTLPLILSDLSIEGLFLEYASVNVWFLLGGCIMAFAILPIKQSVLWNVSIHSGTAILMLTKAYPMLNQGQINNEFMLLLRIIIMSAGLLVFMYALALYRDEVLKAKLETQKVEQLAYEDSLTGIANRRKILDVLTQLEQSQESFSIVLWDIDYFKKVNDSYGHDIGDAVLKGLAELARKHIRKQDYLARWGGEEFMFVLPNTKLEEAYQFTERFRQILERQVFLGVGHVTASFGVASFTDEALKDLLKRADKGLYKAKDAGRNRVECALT